MFQLVLTRLFVFGFCVGTYVLVITSRKEVGTYLGYPVFRVMSMKFLSCTGDLRNLNNQQVSFTLQLNFISKLYEAPLEVLSFNCFIKPLLYRKKTTLTSRHCWESWRRLPACIIPTKLILRWSMFSFIVYWAPIICLSHAKTFFLF